MQIGTPWEIIDGHCHVASTRYIPPHFLRGVAANMLARATAYGTASPDLPALLGMLERQHSDHSAAQLIAEMDEANIGKSVLLYPDFGVAMDGVLEPEQAIAEHVAICVAYPGRFRLFAGIDPRREQAAARFRRLAAGGALHGLKLYPPCGYSPSDRMLYPIYEVCAEYALPVLFHSGPSSPALSNLYADPICVDQAAADFPSVNFIIGHGGVNHTESAALLCAYRPNVYLDFSAFASSAYPRGWKAQLTDLFQRKINHKVIFGTDWPVVRKPGGLAALMKELLSPSGPLSTVPERDRALIMGGNMARLLPL